MRNLKKNAEAVVVAIKETRLELNADKTKYMVMSRDQNAGRSHRIKTDNSSFKSMEQFKNLEQPERITFLIGRKLRAD